MSTSKILERGYVAALVIAFGTTLGDSDLGNTKTATIEPGTIITDGALDITTLFDGTTPTLTVTDGTTVFVNAVAAGSAGNTVMTTGKGKFFPSGGTVTMSNGGTSVTAGQAFWWCSYVKATGKINEIITN